LDSPSSIANDPALASQYRKYDVDKSKQLLADAGYPNGFKTTLYIEPNWAAGNGRDIAVSVQANWAKVGIIVDLQFHQSGAWQVMSTALQAPKVSSLLAQPFGEWRNFNTSLNVFFPKADGGFYYQFTQKPGGQAAWDALKDKSLQAPAPDPVILKDIGDKFFADVTVFPLFYAAFIYVVNPKLQDAQVLGYGTVQALDYPNIWLSK
jgi:ABC-type transport system substrate-binding protein